MNLLLDVAFPHELGPVVLVMTTAKATLILIAAAILVAALRRASAAVRYMVWSLALSALLVLPLLSLALPHWTISMPRPGAEVGSLPGVDAFISLAADTIPTASPDAPQGTSGATVAVIRAVREGRHDLLGGGLSDRLLAAWAVGALLVFVWVLVGQEQARRLTRRAEPIADPDWVQLLESASRDFEVHRPVALLRSDRTDTPATWGIFRSVVLLPSGADAWPAERRRAVLLHELAHVKRRDCLTHLLAQLACALFWFHPGAWYASGRLRVERERACDDLALGAGMRASDYAGHLLDIEHSLRWARRIAPATVAMAQRPQLETRLRAILDAAQSRWAPTRVGNSLFALAALGLVLPIAAVRLGEVEVPRRALPRVASVLPHAVPGDLRPEPQRFDTRASESAGSPRPREHTAVTAPKAELERSFPSPTEWTVPVVEPEIVAGGATATGCTASVGRGERHPDRCSPTVVQTVRIVAHAPDAGSLSSTERTVAIGENDRPRIGEAMLTIAVELPNAAINGAPVLAPDRSPRTGLRTADPSAGLPRPGQTRVLEAVGGWIRVILRSGSLGGERYPSTNPRW
jgi:beta-lactamase regulating signal transducer with metallopeptidase domain